MLKEIMNNGFRWTDLEKPNKDDLKEVGLKYGFHELNLEDCLSKIQIPKIDRYQDHVFVTLHFPTPIENEAIAESSQLAAFMGSKFLVTVHQGDLKSILDIFQQCKHDEKTKEELMGSSAGYLFHSIVDALTNDLFERIRKIVGSIDDIEDLVFDEKESAASEISHIRRQITSLRRVVIPLRRTLSEFAARDIQRFSEEDDLAPYFDDIKDHIEKVIETLEESKETIEIYKDTDSMHGIDKSNKILSILTIVFTLSMPVTIVSSLYGMNVEIPGADEAATFLGKYTTFTLILAGSGGIALVMLVCLYKIRWV